MGEQLQMTIAGREYVLELSGTLTGYWLVFLRVVVGWWFLHEGLTKYVTPGSFRAGWFLETTGTVVSPVLNAFAGGATVTAINVVVPLGEVLIGLGLLVGCLTRTAAFFGACLMYFFYFGGEHWRRGLVNGDLLGLVLFVTILVFGAGRVWGIDAALERTEFVRNRPWLRYLLG